VATIHPGDFVKVDQAGHITGKVSQNQAVDSANGRRVTARENQADPEVCRKYHAVGRADVETAAAISFCLVRPVAAPAQ
jgi:hypothetical protein